MSHLGVMGYASVFLDEVKQEFHKSDTADACVMALHGVVTAGGVTGVIGEESNPFMGLPCSPGLR